MNQTPKLVPPTRDDIFEAMAGRGASVTLSPAVGGFYVYWTEQRALGRTFYPREGNISDQDALDRKYARERKGTRPCNSHDKAPGVLR